MPSTAPITDTEMQCAILNRLMFADKLKYSELHKDFADDHDLFNYHLRELVKKGFIKKDGQAYTLALKGRQCVAVMEEDGQYQKQFKVSMFIDVMRKNKGKDEMLLFRRLKHPHYGYVGAVAGKLHWGETLEDNLQRELDEELKIKAKSWKNIGLVRDIFTNEEGETVGDGVYFVIVVDEWEGLLQPQNIEGEYFWHDVDKILEMEKIFRVGFEKNLPYLKRYLKNPKNYTQYILEYSSAGLKY